MQFRDKWVKLGMILFQTSLQDTSPPGLKLKRPILNTCFFFKCIYIHLVGGDLPER